MKLFRSHFELKATLIPPLMGLLFFVIDLDLSLARTRQIDGRYVLSDSNFAIDTSYLYVTSSLNGRNDSGLVGFRQKLNDKYTLLWLPIPLGIQYAPEFTSEDVTLVQWTIQPIYKGPMSNLDFMPNFLSYYRVRIGAKWAWETKLQYGVVIPTHDSSKSAWFFLIGVGPLFQVTDRWLLGLKATAQFEALAWIPETGYNEGRDTNFTAPNLPISLDSSYFVTDFWEVRTGAIYRMVDRQRAKTLAVSLGLSFYW